MPRSLRPTLRCLAALLMTALWLPATQHCTLDALGVLEAHVIYQDCDTGCATHGAETQHAHDTCVLVECSQWLNTADRLDAAPPQAGPRPATPSPADMLRAALRVAIPALCAQPSSPPVFQPFGPSAFCHGWFPSRHFAVRAAPVSRAPAPALA